MWPTLLGTVFAHRVFDLVPVGILVVWVLATAKIPNWAFTSLAVVLAIGVGLFLFAFATARYYGHTRLEGLGTVRRVVTMARQGPRCQVRRWCPACLLPMCWSSRWS